MDRTAKLSLVESAEKQIADIDRVMIELDHLKKQTERLDMINQLHARVAGVSSLSGMIETYSVWLMPQVEHELIGYSNSVRRKKHLFCSSHGPSRRRAIAFAEQVIGTGDKSQGVYKDELGHFACKWLIERADDSGVLLILKADSNITEEQSEIITESLSILSDSLQRALDYEELFERACNDPLTGLSNRRVFEERVPEMMDSATRYGKPLTMLSMDLDKFKQINDNLGHVFGDVVLKSVARVLKKAVRSSDLLARVGGDEFILVLDSTDKWDAQILAERLCKAVDELGIWADDKTKLGISIGLAQLEGKESLQSWLERVDDILYHAKAQGRCRVATR